LLAQGFGEPEPVASLFDEGAALLHPFGILLDEKGSSPEG
jgi:hypothetical protein